MKAKCQHVQTEKLKKLFSNLEHLAVAEKKG